VLISGFIYYEGRDVNIRDAIGNCPLYYAAANGDLPFVQWLLDMQADVNFLCKDGNTPLHAAFRTGD
jgi:ankyrin repeat protein